MLTRTTTRAALLTVLGCALIGGGAAHADEASSAPPTTPVPPTCTCPPPTTAAPAAPVTTAAPAADGVATTVAAPAAGVIPPNATLEQLQQGIMPMFGPTTDVMSEFSIFGVTPLSGVPTPADAVIEEFLFGIDGLYFPDDAYYRGVLIVTSSQPAADLLTLYQTEMPAAGYVQTGDAVEQLSSGAQVRWLDYDLPNPTHSGAEISIAIIDGDNDYIQIEWRDGADPSIGQMFTSWSGLPIVDQAASINSGSIGNYISGDRLQLDTSYQMPILPEAIEQQFLDGLAGTPFTQDVEGSEPGSWARLDGGPFDDVTVHFGDGVAEGQSRLSVHTYLDL